VQYNIHLSINYYNTSFKLINISHTSPPSYKQQYNASLKTQTKSKHKLVLLDGTPLPNWLKFLPWSAAVYSECILFHKSGSQLYNQHIVLLFMQPRLSFHIRLTTLQLLEFKIT